ncbi:glycosyltransferase family 2 protein, partial [Candidatus Aerophobetes bacterium]|nr:glycosyltransferase family 2 protein [Candidatus Aerophobetes bacterium]
EVWIKNGKFINPGKRHAKYSGWIYPFCLPLCIISCSSVIIHRSVFEEVGVFDPHLPAAEDYDLWLRITSRFPVKLISKKLIIKRGGHPDQLSKKYWGMDRFRIFSLEKMVKENNLPLAWRIATLREIARKAQIVASGARKREKWEDYRFYSYKARTAEKEASFLLSQL